MSPPGLPPPSPECLWRPYGSNPKRKGGTVIVEDVLDALTHEKRRCTPDGYRPEACPSCGEQHLHVHDYRKRTFCGVTLVRYRCVACKATWRMMPLFVARMLWRTWACVESHTLGPPPGAADPKVPKRTVRRWRARLAMAAMLLVGLLGDGSLAEIGVAAGSVGPAATRRELVLAVAETTNAPKGERLARLAAIAHRLEPGVRLM